MDDKLKQLKLSVGRAQLSTATSLFIRNKDPISVQCLAGGACEVLEDMTRHYNVEPFSSHILAEYPSLDIGKLRKVQRKYWNAMKHVSVSGNQLPRDDRELLESFDDTKNDAMLFIGWYDYVAIVGTLPVEAQVFQFWYFATNEEKLSDSADFEVIRGAWPNIANASREEQKRRLRRSVDRWRKDKDLLDDPRTEPRLQTSP